MTNSKKNLITRITILDKKLQSQQMKVEQHKENLANLIHSNRFELITLLLPAFWWGWKQGRIKSTASLLKELAKIGLLSGIGYLKRK